MKNFENIFVTHYLSYVHSSVDAWSHCMLTTALNKERLLMVVKTEMGIAE